MISRILPAIALLLLVASCAKPPDLADTVITATSREDFTRFRAELGTRFPADRLKDFDIATRELQLDAMNRGIASADAREMEMLRAANGKTVQAVTVLGWGARKARFLREIGDITTMLERDLALQAKSSAAGTPAAITRRIGSEKEVLAQLQRQLAETEAHLAEMHAPATPGS